MIRERIAAVLTAQMKTRGWITPETMADAIIDELKLRPDTVGTLTRYVTEWEHQ